MDELNPYKKYINYDLTLKAMSITGLKWLPYIGNNFTQLPDRVLVVGLSHYDLDDNESWTNTLKKKTPNIESIVHNGLGIYNNGNINKNRMCRGLERVFFNQPQYIVRSPDFNSSREKFWSSIAFHQLIETPMIGSSKHDNKIEKNEFNEAILKLLDLVIILKVNTVIMMSNSFKYHMEIEKPDSVSENYDKRIYEAPVPGKTDIRTCYFKMDEFDFSFSAILHPSRYRYINFQHSLLKRTIPKFIKYITA